MAPATVGLVQRTSVQWTSAFLAVASTPRREARGEAAHDAAGKSAADEQMVCGEHIKL